MSASTPSTPSTVASSIDMPSVMRPVEICRVAGAVAELLCLLDIHGIKHTDLDGDLAPLFGTARAILLRHGPGSPPASDRQDLCGACEARAKAAEPEGQNPPSGGSNVMPPPVVRTGQGDYTQNWPEQKGAQ